MILNFKYNPPPQGVSERVILDGFSWSWAAPCMTVSSSVPQRGISGLETSKLDSQGWLWKDLLTEGRKGLGLWGHYCDFKSKRTEESFMRGNEISSKQNCFLGETPRAICEERDSRKKKYWKFNLRKRWLKIYYKYQSNSTQLFSVSFFSASKNYLLYKSI